MQGKPEWPEVKHIPSDKLPEVRDRLGRALQRMAAMTPAYRCRHIGGEVTGILCAEHPAAGLFCPTCADEHVARHTWDVEHECDVCGHPGMTMAKVIGEASVVVPTITAAVIALGTCLDCAGASGLEVEVVG